MLLKVGDDVSTDEIMPAGAEVLTYRSNIPTMAEFVYRDVDEEFVQRAQEHEGSGFVITGHGICHETRLSERQIDMIRVGSLVSQLREES